MDWIYPTQFEGLVGTGIDWLSIPKAEIPELVAEYVSKLETERTNDMCKCQWIVHPDDSKLAQNQCRMCRVVRADHLSKEDMDEKDAYWGAPHDWTGRRMRRGEQNPECPVHTKEGFIMGFFEWVFKDEVPEIR